MTAFAVGAAGGDHRGLRHAADFYPTPTCSATALAHFLGLPAGTSVWEPACGEGDLSRVFARAGCEVVSTDLLDRGFGEPGRDFLREETLLGDWIITNPPFDLAADFIRHGLSLRPAGMAMLLKATYWHAKRRRALFEAHPPAWVLAHTWRPNFTRGLRGKSPTMDVSWVVWLPEFHDTRYKLLSKPEVADG